MVQSYPRPTSTFSRVWFVDLCIARKVVFVEKLDQYMYFQVHENEHSIDQPYFQEIRAQVWTYEMQIPVLCARKIQNLVIV